VLAAAFTLCSAGVFAQAKSSAPPAAGTSKKTPPKPGVAEKVKSSKKHAGLFTVYQDTVTGSVQMYVRKDQLNKDFIYQRFSLSGPTSLFLHQSMHRATLVFKMKKSYDKRKCSSAILCSTISASAWQIPSAGILEVCR
jgi:hypothetical protein